MTQGWGNSLGRASGLLRDFAGALRKRPSMFRNTPQAETDSRR